jgi:hypothetical protein
MASHMHAITRLPLPGHTEPTEFPAETRLSLSLSAV